MLLFSLLLITLTSTPFWTHRRGGRLEVWELLFLESPVTGLWFKSHQHIAFTQDLEDRRKVDAIIGLPGTMSRCVASDRWQTRGLQQFSMICKLAALVFKAVRIINDCSFFQTLQVAFPDLCSPGLSWFDNLWNTKNGWFFYLNRDIWYIIPKHIEYWLNQDSDIYIYIMQRAGRVVHE